MANKATQPYCFPYTVTLFGRRYEEIVWSVALGVPGPRPQQSFYRVELTVDAGLARALGLGCVFKGWELLDCGSENSAYSTSVSPRPASEGAAPPRPE